MLIITITTTTKHNPIESNGTNGLLQLHNR